MLKKTILLKQPNMDEHDESHLAIAGILTPFGSPSKPGTTV
jgi:hypothetical protein